MKYIEKIIKNNFNLKLYCYLSTEDYSDIEYRKKFIIYSTLAKYFDYEINYINNNSDIEFK